MQNWQLADLDELILLCQVSEAKNYIAEAVACYRAGSFRACILTTWIALVFDFIGKLRQLAMADDVNAKNQVELLDTMLRDNNFTELLKFERSILEKAKDEFGFISMLEFNDLNRLFEDRNKCAHPSMRSVEEPYHPTPETARYHLRNAVIYMLQYPPAHGKATLSILLDKISSPYFPEEIEKAVLFLNDTPLKRARSSLVRGFVVELLNQMMIIPIEQRAKAQRYSIAIQATMAMHHSEVQQLLEQKATQILGKIQDNNLAQLILTLCLIPSLWDVIRDELRLKCMQYVKTMPRQAREEILFDVLQNKCFAEATHDIMPQLEMEDVIQLVRDYLHHQMKPSDEIIDRAVTIYCNIGYFDGANRLAINTMIPLTSYMKPIHFKSILKASEENGQMFSSFEFSNLLKTWLGSVPSFSELVDDIIESAHLEKLKKMVTRLRSESYS